MDFIGEYNHTLDIKNRIIVPSKLRDILGSPYVMTKGLDGCIYCYPINEWEKIVANLKNQPMNKSEVRKFIVKFTSGAEYSEVDKQGRSLVPSKLVEYANLKDDIVIVGALNKMQIWDKTKWDEYQNDDNFNFEEVAESIDFLEL